MGEVVRLPERVKPAPQLTEAQQTAIDEIRHSGTSAAEADVKLMQAIYRALNSSKES